MMSGRCALWAMTTSAKRVEQQLCVVLHSRPYRETSALVDYFSRDQGVIRAVVKGVRGAQSRQRHLTQPFQCLELNWQGSGELKTLFQGDLVGPAAPLQGRSLWCGLYLNELSLRVLPPADPQPKLFAYYQLALTRLTDPQQQEVVLRIYERQLLQLLGFGIDFQFTASGQRIEIGCTYHFDPKRGFDQVAATATAALCYSGSVLVALAQDDYQHLEVRRAAKQLMRQALAPHLGGRPLHSRALFQPLQSSSSIAAGLQQ
ncbi:MAG: DNA repair protein RecO (recombination protein O) [Motiliproteus sp.]|jgi:DNA repair protein RecO (recombination protein O)